MSGLAKEVFQAQNKFRQNPTDLVKILQKILTYFDGTVIRFPGNPVGLQTNEGQSAYKEAIAFLKAAKPLPALIYSPQLQKAALDHAKDIGPKGITGHTGSDGSSMSNRIDRYCDWSGTIGENIDFGQHSAEDVIAALVVDDGVASRGHRKNVFSPDFKYTGIGIADHKQYKQCTVFDYAGGVGKKGAKPSGGTSSSSVASSSGGKTKLDLQFQNFKNGIDQHAPADMASATVNMSTKTQNGKTIKTLVKKYKLHGGGEKTISLTQTIG